MLAEAQHLPGFLDNVLHPRGMDEIRLVDDNDERTPKAKAMMLWGRDEVRSRGNFPDKDKIKDTLKKQVFDESLLDIANYLLG